MLRSIFQQKRLIANHNALDFSYSLSRGLISQQQKMSFSSAKKRDISSTAYDTSQLSEEQINYINKVQNLKYNELVTECKVLKLKPKDRTRQSLIQAIIKQVPEISQQEQNSQTQNQKNEVLVSTSSQGSTKKGPPEEGDTRSINREIITDDIKKVMKQILSKEENSRFILQYNNPSAGDYPTKKIEIDRIVQLRNQINQSSVLNEYDEYILTYVEPKPSSSVHYVENYSFEQQQQNVEEMNPLQVNKEISLLVNRSNFINECEKSYSQKLKQSKGENKFLFSQILSIEQEYCNVFQDEVKQFMKEVANSRLANLSVVHITKTLSDPISFWHYASFFKWGSPSTIITLWKALTLTIDFYDIDNIQTLTRCLYMIRKYSGFQTPEETHFFEKLTTIILQIVSEKDNQISYFYIANILGYLKQIGGNFNNKTMKNLQSIAEIYVDIYRQDLEKQSLIQMSENTKNQENYMVSPEVLDNSSPDFHFRVLLALSYYNNPPQIIINHLFKNLVDAGLEYFEKGIVVKILSQLMLSNIPLSDALADAIRKNRKVINELSIREIYVFIYSFKDSNQELGKLYFHFYFSIGLFLDNVTILNDFKQVVMIAKIQHFILTYKINEHKRNFLEKRTNQVLNLINKSCTDVVCRDYIIDLIYISSLFIPYLNKPDFLFSKIVKHIQYLKVNSENRPLFTNFILRILEKLNPHYEFFINSNIPDIEHNDKCSADVKDLLNLMIKKFIESKLLSFFLLTVQLCAAPNLLKQVVSNDNERHELTKNMALQIIKILGNENNKFGFSNLVMFSNFIETNLESIQDTTIILKVQQVIFQSIQNINQKTSQNEDLLWIYYHSNILSKIQGKQTNNEKKLLSEYFVKKVLQPICENQIGVVSQIIHENGIVQYFNSNVNYSNIQNIVHIPTILKNLNIDINKSPQIQKYLIPKIIKESKFWNGEQLVNNLLTLHALKINCFEVFENVCENLFTTMNYYTESQEFSLNNEIFSTKEKLIDLLNAYSEQYIQYLALNPKYEVSNPKNFAALNVLACYVFKQLSPSTLQLFALFQTINYSSTIIGWVKNKDLSFKVDLKLKQNVKNINFADIEHQLQYYKKEKMFNDHLTEQFVNKLSNENNKEYFQNLLEYLSMGEIISTETQLDVLLKYYDTYYESLTTDSHLNMIQIIINFQIMNEKALLLPKNFDLHEPSFYKKINRVEINGKVYNIPYQESFTLNDDYQVPQYKIFPKLSRQEETYNEEQMNLPNDTQNNKPENNKSQEEQNIFNEEIGQKVHAYLKELTTIKSSNQAKSKSLNRFYIYYLIAKKKLNETHYSEEERIINEFKQQQVENLLQMKQTENYSNFLIDFQTVLNDFSDVITHEINYKNEDSQKINIDIAVKFNQSEQKVGFIFVDEALTKVEDNNNQQFLMNSLTRMQIELLEKHHGWTIYPIYYQKWCETFNNSTAKYRFIQKALKLNE